MKNEKEKHKRRHFHISSWLDVGSIILGFFYDLNTILENLNDVSYNNRVILFTYKLQLYFSWHDLAQTDEQWIVTYLL